MFGDAGHGFLVLLVGLYLVLRERHLVELSRTNEVWQLAKNKLLFTNSFKKKISVILGVSQMVLGVCLSLTINVLCDFIPQIIFMLVIFGYLCACIFAKWILFTAKEAGDAPNLLIDFINMFLMSYPSEPKSIAVWYPGQKAIQIIFILLALVLHVEADSVLQVEDDSVLHLEADSVLHVEADSVLHVEADSVLHLEADSVLHVEAGSVNQDPETDSGTVLSSDSSQTSQSAMLGDSSVTEQADIGEVFIQQAIHAIEYCLGCVSHTASYLRLWALSLAHAELSEVLWHMVFRMGLQVRGPAGSVAIFIVFLPFAFLTVSILLTMEGLVEFQSKFYKGEGVSFVPFSFRTLLENRDDSIRA
ncbi:hypothetical protein NP493_240g03007 [Ridgeia piscesae]|uniref:V-type proton ATPase subunit a n=1 Tax=Ridgeia piscesae TaxID=27915 RepID=A0AAD9NZH4_RIDPI|nr:hypothetical protein NP493_240g03007 [Ridgeia piscesae]